MTYTSVNTAGWKANPIDWEQSKSQIEITIKTKVYADVANTLKKSRYCKSTLLALNLNHLYQAAFMMSLTRLLATTTLEECG